jgi:hypothetical protein
MLLRGRPLDGPNEVEGCGGGGEEGGSQSALWVGSVNFDFEETGEEGALPRINSSIRGKKFTAAEILKTLSVHGGTMGDIEYTPLLARH